MKFYLCCFFAAAAFLFWTSWYSDGNALASSGFTGSWCGNSRSAYMITNFGPRVVVKQGMSEVSSAHYAFNAAQLVAERWRQTATLGSGGDKLHWSDGSVWTRAIYGTQLCNTFAAMSATPAPPAYRYLSFVTVALRHPIPPLTYWDVWTVMSNNSNVGYTCFSFKNTSSVTATRVLVALSLMNQNGQVVDSGHIDRKGTFSPNAEIHGWPSIAEWSSGQGHHGYKDNCTKWAPDDQAQALAYPHVQSYNLHAERIEYADGTTWPQPEKASPQPEASPAQPSPSPEHRLARK
jgi:hypothetical protein